MTFWPVKPTPPKKNPLYFPKVILDMLTETKIKVLKVAGRLQKEINELASRFTLAILSGAIDPKFKSRLLELQSNGNFGLNEIRKEIKAEVSLNKRQGGPVQSTPLQSRDLHVEDAVRIEEIDPIDEEEDEE